MKPAYPELQDSIERISKIVREEETRYAATFQIAERFFQDEAKQATNGILPGAAAFKLYDTYGLALDEQEEMAREFGLTIDRATSRLKWTSSGRRQGRLGGELIELTWLKLTSIYPLPNLSVASN